MAVVTIQEQTIPALISRMAQDVEQKINQRLQKTERFMWVLSGGHTPQKLYETLAQEPYRSRLPWKKLWIFWGDERPVPPAHPDSNFRMANEALLRHVPIPEAHIFRMKGELPPAEAAHAYEQDLRRVFGDVSDPMFDLILLGLGPDGHTASLFPGTAAVTVTDRWVVENRVPSLNTMRITLTFPVLNQAREISFLATGADKVDAYAHVRASADPRYPASLVSPAQGNLNWYIDTDIAKSFR